MRRTIHFILAIVLIAAFSLIVPPHRTEAQSSDCRYVSGAYVNLGVHTQSIAWTATYIKDDKIHFAIQHLSGTATVSIGLGGVQIFSQELSADASFDYTVPGTVNGYLSFSIPLAQVPISSFKITLNCTNPSFPPVVPPKPEVPSPVVPGPGPDMIPIPADAAMGTFITDSPLYYAPDILSLSSYSMKAGQSL